MPYFSQIGQHVFALLSKNISGGGCINPRPAGGQNLPLEFLSNSTNVADMNTKFCVPYSTLS